MREQHELSCYVLVQEGTWQGQSRAGACVSSDESRRQILGTRLFPWAVAISPKAAVCAEPWVLFARII